MINRNDNYHSSEFNGSLHFEVNRIQSIKLSREKHYFTAIVILLNLSSAAYATANNQYFPYGVLGATLIAFARTPPSKFLFIPKNKLFFLFGIFVISLILSSLYHLEVSLFLTLGGMLCSFLLINYFRVCLNKQMLVHVLKVYTFIQLFLIVYSISKSGFSVIYFQGVFRNPNTMGLIASTGLLSLIPLLYLEKWKLFKKIIIVFLILFFLIVTIASSSRTSFIVSLMGLLLAPFLDGNLFSKQKIRFFIILIFLLGIFMQTDFFYDSIYYKFKFYAETGDVLNERGDVWEIAFVNPAIFGYGRNMALENHVGESIYISVLFQFGLICLASLLLVIILSIYSQLPKKKNLYQESRSTLICISLGFALHGFAASVFGASIYWLWIFGIGFSIYEISLVRRTYLKSLLTTVNSRKDLYL
jgi:hypothetical protein